MLLEPSTSQLTTLTPGVAAITQGMPQNPQSILMVVYIRHNILFNSIVQKYFIPSFIII